VTESFKNPGKPKAPTKAPAPARKLPPKQIINPRGTKKK
jgi:hypothetical protein